MLSPPISHSPTQRDPPPAGTIDALLAPWRHACHQISLGLDDLTEAVHVVCRDQPDRDEILAALREAAREVTDGLQAFELGLTSNLSPQALTALLDAARKRLPDDELIHMLDHNGFTELRLADTLQYALDGMSRMLATPP